MLGMRSSRILYERGFETQANTHHVSPCVQAPAIELISIYPPPGTVNCSTRKWKLPATCSLWFYARRGLCFKTIVIDWISDS